MSANRSRLVELIAKAIDRFGGIDILVSNAGGPRAGRFADLSTEDYQTALHLNLLSTINLCRGVVPSMKARGRRAHNQSHLYFRQTAGRWIDVI